MEVKTEVTFSFDQEAVKEIIAKHLLEAHGVTLTKDEIIVQIDDSHEGDRREWHAARIRSIIAKVDISRVGKQPAAVAKPAPVSWYKIHEEMTHNQVEMGYGGGRVTWSGKMDDNEMSLFIDKLRRDNPGVEQRRGTCSAM